MSLLYKFVKHSGRFGLPFYFGRLEINGKEHIPKEAPYIIAPNHQSAFLDAVLMGTYHKKPISFLTCLLYTSPSPRDQRGTRMPSSA